MTSDLSPEDLAKGEALWRKLHGEPPPGSTFGPIGPLIESGPLTPDEVAGRYLSVIIRRGPPLPADQDDLTPEAAAVISEKLYRFVFSTLEPTDTVEP